MTKDITAIAVGLVRAASMSADDLAKEKGENNLFVQIKRNGERLASCSGHLFEPQPNWRELPPPYLNRTVHCLSCGGDMRTSDAHNYLRGLAHGSGQDYKVLCEAIWPSPIKSV